MKWEEIIPVIIVGGITAYLLAYLFKPPPAKIDIEVS